MYSHRTQKCSHSFSLLISAACAIPLLGGTRALAEPAPIPARMVPVEVDSGRVEDLRAEPAVVFSQAVDLGPDVPWLRVHFDKETTLAPGTPLRTSLSR